MGSSAYTDPATISATTLAPISSPVEASSSSLVIVMAHPPA
jgi:hypothetical protein